MRNNDKSCPSIDLCDHFLVPRWYGIYLLCVFANLVPLQGVTNNRNSRFMAYKKARDRPKYTHEPNQLSGFVQLGKEKQDGLRECRREHESLFIRKVYRHAKNDKQKRMHTNHKAHEQPDWPTDTQNGRTTRRFVQFYQFG